MKWQLKLIKDTLFGLAPFPETLRKIKRKFIPYESSPNAKRWTIEQGIMQVQMLHKTSFPVYGKTALELGTGWEPLIPLIFYLAGCQKIILIDSQRLLNRETVISSINDLINHREIISDGLKISSNNIKNLLEVPETSSLDKIFAKFNFEYRAPIDARNTKLSDKTIDLIFSRAVLEYIPPTINEEIFIEFNRILKDQGKMCYVIDNSDHWEHYDKSISRLNFLKFEDSIWRLTSINPLAYINRLRHYEYLNMMDHAGFNIDYDGSKVDEQALKDLKKIKICKKYKNVPPERLAILTSYIVASKK